MAKPVHPFETDVVAGPGMVPRVPCGDLAVVGGVDDERRLSEPGQKPGTDIVVERMARDGLHPAGQMAVSNMPAASTVTTLRPSRPALPVTSTLLTASAPSIFCKQLQ